MADIFDQASERETIDRELAIASTLQRINASKLPATGACHNCAERLPASELFCDIDCKTDYEKRQRRA